MERKTINSNPATAIWNQRHEVVRMKERLLDLYEAVDHHSDLYLYQWVQFTTTALEFKPDLILELGRGRGNSTCAFNEAAQYIEGCEVVSICNSEDWEKLTYRRVRKVVPSEWFNSLRIISGDILQMNYDEILEGKNRILLLWDAHGFDVAECVLGTVLPLLVDKQNFVIMHDISDNRYLSREQASYNGKRLWRGNNWDGPRLFLGTMDTCVEQAIAIMDFTSRNRLPLHSADHDFHTELGEDERKVKELNRCLGKPFFDDSLQVHWRWFSLNEGEQPFFFPHFDPAGTK